MTRDEALAKMPQGIRCNGGISDEQLIDRLCALGLLKLDEPKSAQERFYDVVAAELAVDSPAMREPKDNKRAVGMILLDALNNAGLRIVEK